MSRGIEPNRLSSDTASILNELSTMRLDPPRAGSTLNSSSRILQLAEQAATRKEVAKHRRRSGLKQQIDGMAESTPNASSRILQLAEQAATRKEVTKHGRRPGRKRQIDGVAESTPNASSRILQLAEVSALRKEGANLQQRSKQGSMVRAELDAAEAPANIQSASQGSLRKRETTSSRGMSAPTSSADTQFRARGSSQNINESAVRMPEPYIHFEQFFAHYPRFQYDPSAPVSVQYKAMCRKYGFPPKSNYWEVKSELDLEADAAQAGFRLAMVRTFNDLFGTDANSLKNWQSFCAVLDISPVPLTLEACRAAVRDVHVNLVDLVNWGMMGAEIRKFETLEELSTYTKVNGKFFPQSEAEAGGFLRFLLRPILRGLKGAYHG